MRANVDFSNLNQKFWAYVRTISEASGYSTRGSDKVKTFSFIEMNQALQKLGRPTDLLGSKENPSDFARLLQNYFDYRADTLNGFVKNNLLDAASARNHFELVKHDVGACNRTEISDANDKLIAVEYDVDNERVRVPMNKQKDEKRAESYLTGMVNLLVAKSLDGRPCDYDPRKIPVIDHDGTLYAALSRRMDGSFPATTNPISMWEIKEYYYTTTFGSKISDAVYITSLDGYERIELERSTGINIEHLIIVDAYDTWWGKGKSYLCRMMDILHMGHVDEILFGKEVRARIPELVTAWIGKYDDIANLNLVCE